MEKKLSREEAWALLTESRIDGGSGDGAFRADKR